MTRTLLAAWVAAWGVSAGAPPPAAAQETEPPRELTRSVGVSVSPWLWVYDESNCCSGLGVWLQVGRLQLDHAFAINVWHLDRHWYKEEPDRFGRYWGPVTLGINGHATTVLVDLKTWRRPRYVARFRIGAGHRVKLEEFPPLHVQQELNGNRFGPAVRHFATLHVGLTFDFSVGRRGIVRAGMLGSLPVPPEPRLGAGWKF